MSVPYDLTNAFPAMQNGSVNAGGGLLSNATGAFAALETATTIYLGGEGATAAPPTLPALVSVTDFRIEGFGFPANPILAPQLAVVSGDFRVVFNTFTNGFPLMPSLTSATLFEIYGNDGPFSLGAQHFPVLAELTGPSPFFVGANTGLLSMAGAFPALATPGGANSVFYVTNNAALTTLANSFPAFDSSVFNWSLEVSYNAALTSIAGAFAGPGFVASLVRVYGNPLLTNMANFWQLECDGVIEIDSNIALEVCLGSFLNVVGSDLTAININNNLELPTLSQAQTFIDDFVVDGFVGTQQNNNNKPTPLNLLDFQLALDGANLDGANNSTLTNGQALNLVQMYNGGSYGGYFGASFANGGLMEYSASELAINGKVLSPPFSSGDSRLSQSVTTSEAGAWVEGIRMSFSDASGVSATVLVNASNLPNPYRLGTTFGLTSAATVVNNGYHTILWGWDGTNRFLELDGVLLTVVGADFGKTLNYWMGAMPAAPGVFVKRLGRADYSKFTELRNWLDTGTL